MTSALKGICKNIDDTLADFFCVAQELMESQHEMNKLLSDGHILLAKVFGYFFAFDHAKEYNY